MSIEEIRAKAARFERTQWNWIAFTRPLLVALIAMEAWQVWRGTDAAAFQPLYADGVKVETAEDRYTGWNEVRARWLSEWPKIRNFTTSDHRFTRKGTDITESGHYEYQLVKDDGSTSKRNGTYVQRWELQSDGNYRVSAFTLQ